MKKTVGEFREFIAKGNVLDMAVGVIVGGAFGKIVTSLVNDILMPVIGCITGGFDVSGLKIVLSEAVLGEGGEVIKEEVDLMYGSFIQNIVDFLIVAACIFFITRAVMRFKNKFEKKEEEAAEEEPKAPTTEELLTEIRDLLKDKND